MVRYLGGSEASGIAYAAHIGGFIAVSFDKEFQPVNKANLTRRRWEAYYINDPEQSILFFISKLDFICKLIQ